MHIYIYGGPWVLYIIILLDYHEISTTLQLPVWILEFSLWFIIFSHRAVSKLMFVCSSKCRLPSVTYVLVYHSLYDTFAQNESLLLCLLYTNLACSHFPQHFTTKPHCLMWVCRASQSSSHHRESLIISLHSVFSLCTCYLWTFKTAG